jgi:ADP-ribose pyrophosphatase YjhB (NUDIX family)
MIQDNKILVHRSENDDFWALPGGRNEFHEFSEETLIREMKEEINEEVDVERLLWVVENFFDFDEKKYHEIAFYYLMKLKNDSELYKVSEFYGKEDNCNLIFKWVDLKDLKNLEIYPTFLKTKVMNLSDNIEHIKHEGD